MEPVVGRSAWGALPPNRSPGYMVKCDRFVLHHTVGLHPQSIPDAYTEMRRLQREALAKVKPDGTKVYSDIPYGLVCGPGVVFVGRGPNQHDGATDDDTHTDTCSVAVMGDFEEVGLTPDYRAAIDTAFNLCRLVWGKREIVPHHFYYATACPAELDAIIPDLNRWENDMEAAEYFGRVVQLNNPQEPAPVPTTIEGWHVYVHQELNLMRLAIEKLVVLLAP